MEVSQTATHKRQNVSSDSCWEQNRLIPGLLDEISVQILARLPKIYHLNAKLVSRCWKATIMSSELYRCRKELGTTEEWLYILTKSEGEKLMWYALDPISKKWQRLPPMPAIPVDDGPRRSSSGLWLWNLVDSNNRITDVIDGWIERRGELDQVTFCGCAVGAVDGYLYAIGGFVRDTALRSVWRYNPSENAWGEVSPMSTARAYCKTGVLTGKLYVVGGINGDRGEFTPLRSAEVFDPKTGQWSEVPSIPFPKARMLSTAVRAADHFKPIAMGMTSYRGKLYVPISLYSWPFFVDVGGEVYDPEMNAWVKMPNGMGDGWPAGSRLSIVVGGELCALDPPSTLDSGRITVYDHRDDTWKAIEGDIPIRDSLVSPFLLSGILGKLHVIAKDANRNILVMQQVDRRNDLGPIPSTGAVTLERILQEFRVIPVSGSEEDTWKVIASRSSGSAELVSCQILDV